MRHAADVRDTGKASERRSGFTLVEILIVIAIIGMLAALSTVAVRAVKYTADKTAIQIEMDQLKQAINGYKEKTREYPPCFGDTQAAGEGTTHVISRFINHMRYAFPRFNPQGADALEQYRNIRQEILDNYRVRLTSGQVISIDLDDLVLNENSHSPAEALVFWLSGMPMPLDTNDGGNPPMGTQKTAGFNSDGFNPFRFFEQPDPNASKAQQRAVWIQKRTPSLYAFNANRLVDLDNDGWLEYVPDRVEDKRAFVYFDHKAYARPGAGAYAQGGGQPQDQPGYRPYIHPAAVYNASTVDTVVPYAQQVLPGQTRDFSTGTSILWAADSTFQLLCAGLDGQFSPPEVSRTFTLLPNVASPTDYSAGGYMKSGNQKMFSLSLEEGDNLTSFSNDMIKDILYK